MKSELAVQSCYMFFTWQTGGGSGVELGMNFVSASSFLSHYYFNKKKTAGLSSFFFGHFFLFLPVTSQFL